MRKDQHLPEAKRFDLSCFLLNRNMILKESHKSYESMLMKYSLVRSCEDESFQGASMSSVI